VLRGLGREELFVTALEQFPTETAAFADVILPATTQLEHLDVLWSWGHRYLTLNRPAIAPRGLSRPNTEIFRMLANVMADVDERFSHKSFADDDEELLATYLAAYPIEVADGVRERGWAKVVVSERPGVKVDLRSDRAGALGLDAVPDGRDPEPDDGRFTVVTPKSHHFLNSTFVNHARLHRMAGAPVVRIASADASRLGVTEGARVKLRSESGEIEVAAEVADDVLVGTLVLLSNWWGGDFAGGAGVNVLTSQRLADVGGAPVFTPRVELSLVTS
jgi:anaerobic selenocysteine-containing dehydrogenase